MSYTNLTLENFDKLADDYFQFLSYLMVKVFDDERGTFTFDNETWSELDIYLEATEHKQNLNTDWPTLVFLLENRFLQLFKFSHTNAKYFGWCSATVYQATFESRFATSKKKYIDYTLVNFATDEIKQVANHSFPFVNEFSQDTQNLIYTAHKKKMQFLRSFLLKHNIEPVVSGSFDSILNVNSVTFKSVQEEHIINIKKQPKSLLLDGRALNLNERFQIANKILDIDKKLRALNIPELKKAQVLAYILGCDKDNARDLMNGTYPGAIRDLSSYYLELGLIE